MHYAVQYNLPKVCQEILEHMDNAEDVQLTRPVRPGEYQDREGITAFDLAVLGGNTAILAVLLEDHNRRNEIARNKGYMNSQSHSLSGHLLLYALQLDSIAVVRFLRRSSADFNYRDHHGNTALHLAVRSRKVEYVADMLEVKVGEQMLELNEREATHGWTPLILASLSGDLAIVELLLREGADPLLQDDVGWRAADYAAFRGWLPMVKELKALTVKAFKENDNYDRQPSEQKARFGLSAILHEHPAQKSLSRQTQILVNLGALDTYRPVIGVDMSSYVHPDPYGPQCEAEFSVEIRAVNGDSDGAKYVVQLPIMEDMANAPWRFLTSSAQDFKLAFEVHHSVVSAHSGDTFIGSAIALLHSLKQGLGAARESLIRDFTIPILHKDTLDFIGTIAFYFLIVAPFPHPDPTRVSQQKQVFPSRSGPPVIGHRGELYMSITCHQRLSSFSNRSWRE